MDEKNYIQSEVTYDLPCHKELVNLNIQTHPTNIILWVFTLICILFTLSITDNPRTAKLFLLLPVYFAIVRVVTYFRNRDGGKVYKRHLYQNNGAVPHNLIILGDTSITTCNLHTDSKLYTSYSDIRYLAESKNLLALVTNLKLVHLIDKNTLSGGSREDAIALLRQKCPKLKKRIRTGLFGRIINVLLCITLICGILWSGAILLQIPQKFSGQLTNDLSYQEIAYRVSEIGITISDQAMLELEEYDREYAREYGDYYRENPDASKALDLLCWEGCGIYDEYTWEWTPSTSGVFWFDWEVYNVDSIYRDFLRGIEAMDQNLTFTSVSEDYSNVQMESNSGTVSFSFEYEGETHHFTADYIGDWFDMNMLYEIGAVLAADRHYEDLWYTFDEGQGVLLYYGTHEQAETLGKLVGHTFFEAVKSPITK